MTFEQRREDSEGLQLRRGARGVGGGAVGEAEAAKTGVSRLGGGPTSWAGAHSEGRGAGA